MSSSVTFRPAQRDELEMIVALLADAELGQTREAEQGSLDPAYISAFEAIERDPGNEVIVGVDADDPLGSRTRQGEWLRHRTIDFEQGARPRDRVL